MSKLGTFSKLSKLFKLSALGCALVAASISSSALAATFKVPVNYSLELVDGKTSDFNYNRFDRTVTLQEGRHQMVFLFEGSFGASRDSRLVQAANPIVVEIHNMPADANYTFTYTMPRNEEEAERFARGQKVNLINADTKTALTKEEASYYLLTSDSGFAILRDYREDLASVGRLYAPAATDIAKEKSNIGVTKEGVETVQAYSNGSRSYTAQGALSQTVITANAQNQAQANSGVEKVQSFSSKESAAIYNEVINLYNSADDSTKLQIVKYIMSH